jgi:hypothetical protein
VKHERHVLSDLQWILFTPEDAETAYYEWHLLHHSEVSLKEYAVLLMSLVTEDTVGRKFSIVNDRS